MPASRVPAADHADPLPAVLRAFAQDDAGPLEDHLAGLGLDVEALSALPRWNAHPSAAERPRADVLDEALAIATRCRAAPRC